MTRPVASILLSCSRVTSQQFWLQLLLTLQFVALARKALAACQTVLQLGLCLISVLLQVYQIISPYTSRLDNVLELYTGAPFHPILLLPTLKNGAYFEKLLFLLLACLSMCESWPG